MDRRGGGGGVGHGGGSGYGRDLRERDRERGSMNRDGYADRRGGMGDSMDYRNQDGRGDDRYAARDRERGRPQDLRAVGESRYDSRDAGASKYAEPSRYRLGAFFLLITGLFHP
jgi:hypothetical protein